MSITISDTSPRVQYTATSGQTTFSVPFEFFDDDDIVVINTNAGGVDTTLTKSSNPSLVTEYSVSGAGETGGGSITLGAGATLNDKYTIYRDLPIARSTDFPNSGTFPIETLNTELDKIVAMMQQNERDFNFTVKAKATTSTAYGLTFPELVANKILSVNSAGNGLIFSQEIGNFRGNWAASTAYVQRDLVKDTSNGNIYIVNTAHTSSGSQPLSSNANSSYYDLIVDAASATSSASAALASATAAAASETAAAASETAAAASESAAATSETNAATSASTASTQASNAANSASAAATSATNASNSASAAATSATNSANSATAAASSATSAAGSASTATTQASNASTSATNAATSASNAATSESNAATSESNAATSASNASTSATNASNSASAASTSATNASNSATSAANSAAAAAASYDTFDDRYLGSKTSDPTLDNDGNALVSGALYFNSSANEMRVYDGANWIAASSAGTASLILYEYTATSGQTTFSGTDDNSASLSYSVDNIIVTLNGVILDPSDYTATSGTSIVLASGATTGDIVNIYAFKSFTVAELNANNLNDGTVPSARLSGAYNGITGVGTLTGLTVNGNLSVDGGTIKLSGNYPTGTDNVGLGDGIFNVLTTGNYNTAIGTASLTSNTSGERNTAIGRYAMANNVSGGYNVFVGMGAGEGQTASNNLGIGYQTLYSASGTQNVGVGNYTLRQVSTGQLNTAVGYNSSRNTDQGVNNVSVGHDSLYANTTGNYNVAIGQASLKSNTSASSSIAVGYQALEANTTGTFNTAVGAEALKANTTGGYNTAMGLNSLRFNTTGSNNTAYGFRSLYVNTGSNNTAVGYQAGYSNTTGVRNVFIGNSAGYSGITASDNIFIGSNAGDSTTSIQNVAIGTDALGVNTSGARNVSIGVTAGGATTTGYDNVHIGHEAGRLATTAIKNTFVGYGSGYYVTSGVANTFIGGYNGNQDGLNLTLTSSTIVLSDGSGNARLYIDNSGNTNVRDGDLVIAAGAKTVLHSPHTTYSVPASTSNQKVINNATQPTNRASKYIVITDENNGVKGWHEVRVFRRGSDNVDGYVTSYASSGVSVAFVDEAGTGTFSITVTNTNGFGVDGDVFLQEMFIIS